MEKSPSTQQRCEKIQWLGNSGIWEDKILNVVKIFLFKQEKPAFSCLSQPKVLQSMGSILLGTCSLSTNSKTTV